MDGPDQNVPLLISYNIITFLEQNECIHFVLDSVIADGSSVEFCQATPIGLVPSRRAEDILVRRTRDRPRPA